jgi:hypothetical protein
VLTKEQVEQAMSLAQKDILEYAVACVAESGDPDIGKTPFPNQLFLEKLTLHLNEALQLSAR